MIGAVRPPPLTPLAAAVLHVPVPERALVVECGDGDAVLLLAREFPAARVRGADSSPALVRAASARVGLDPEGRVAFKRGKPGALPYPDGFFDLVAQVDGHPAAAEVARVLRPGGHLVLANSRLPRFLAVAWEGVQRRRLARQGFVAVQEAEAGNGNFFVARLGDGGVAPPSD
ncbi:MAG TPA: methyltransferase domain-containing protein [Solirubrobacterales bacterium]|jgi:SAM-dependent methyltransferase|nr:methyltransferase domain-containing protein [Solirubrobacterales bacterium]